MQRVSSSLLMTALMVAQVTAGNSPDGVNRSRLKVHIPHSLFKQDGYEHLQASFGVPPHSGSIAEYVYYADSNLCDLNPNSTKIGYPKRRKGADGKMEPWYSPYLLMVDRGGCTFVKKARNAQHSGAAGVLIADTTCLCRDQKCVNASGANSCQTNEPILADDGSGSDVSIPTFFMFKNDADAIKTELVSDRPVQMEMTWSLPTDRVEYDLWTLPTDFVSRDFLRNFKEVAIALGESAYFTPHFVLYDGIRWGCQGADGGIRCNNACTNYGRYCAPATDNDIAGTSVVVESVRRVCIWKHYGERDGVGVQWWDYVTQFMDRCHNPVDFVDTDCIKDAYNRSGVKGELVERCMKDSGGVTGDMANAFLDLEMSARSERGVTVIPTASVNDAAIEGPLSVSKVFVDICAGFAKEAIPEICSRCAGSRHPQSCISGGVATNNTTAVETHAFENAVSDHLFVTMILALEIGLLVGVGVGVLVGVRISNAKKKASKTERTGKDVEDFQNLVDAQE